MKLPEFQQQRRMNTNMTAQRAIVDRSREFQANANIAGTVNKFSEDLEIKRRNANTNTFRMEERTRTQQDWVEANRLINLSKNPDGSFDFDKVQAHDTESRFDWEAIQESIEAGKTEGGKATYTFDQVTAAWWDQRVKSGVSSANNSDQASAYIKTISESQLQNTIKSQVAYNVQRAQYNETAWKKSDDASLKAVTASKANRCKSIENSL
jgi:hypothetical protein